MVSPTDHCMYCIGGGTQYCYPSNISDAWLRIRKPLAYRESTYMYESKCALPLRNNCLPCYSSFYFGFSRQGSPQRICHLHLLVGPILLHPSRHFNRKPPLLGLPIFLFPGSSTLNLLLPIYPSYLPPLII